MSIDTLIGVATTLFMAGFYIYMVRRVGQIARRRGRSVFTWSLIGALAPIPTKILVYFLPARAPDLGNVVRQF